MVRSFADRSFFSFDWKKILLALSTDLCHCFQEAISKLLLAVVSHRHRTIRFLQCTIDKKLLCQLLPLIEVLRRK